MAQDMLRRQGKANFTRPENLHLTLAFIGETNDTEAAKRALDAVCRGAEAFKMTVGGAGNFGDLWWTGIEKNRELESLAQSIRGALRAVGFRIDTKPFKPHITLAREMRAYGEVRLDVPLTEMVVGRVSLMRSERIGGRLVYTEIHGVELRKGE